MYILTMLINNVYFKMNDLNLIDQLIAKGVLRSPEIIKAFKEIKRVDFVLPEDRERADRNYPLPIGYSQTISQPGVVIFMLELLKTAANDKILEVGSGSGWLTSMLAYLVGIKGRVLGVERIPELQSLAQENVNQYGFIDKGVVKIFVADGSKGLPGEAPFDKIIVSASARSVPPVLKEQLKIGGRLVMPVGSVYKQNMVVLDKIAEDTYEERHYPGFVFVPLIREGEIQEGEDD